MIKKVVFGYYDEEIKDGCDKVDGMMMGKEVGKGISGWWGYFV